MSFKYVYSVSRFQLPLNIGTGQTCRPKDISRDAGTSAIPQKDKRANVGTAVAAESTTVPLTRSTQNWHAGRYEAFRQDWQWVVTPQTPETMLPTREVCYPNARIIVILIAKASSNKVFPNRCDVDGPPEMTTDKMATNWLECLHLSTTMNWYEIQRHIWCFRPRMAWRKWAQVISTPTTTASGNSKIIFIYCHSQ